MPNVLLCQGTALALPLKDASVHYCVMLSSVLWAAGLWHRDVAGGRCGV